MKNKANQMKVQTDLLRQCKCWSISNTTWQGILKKELQYKQHHQLLI